MHAELTLARAKLTLPRAKHALLCAKHALRIAELVDRPPNLDDLTDHPRVANDVLDTVSADPEQLLAAAAEAARTIDVGERTGQVRVVVVEEQNVIEILRSESEVEVPSRLLLFLVGLMRLAAQPRPSRTEPHARQFQRSPVRRPVGGCRRLRAAGAGASCPGSEPQRHGRCDGRCNHDTREHPPPDS